MKENWSIKSRAHLCAATGEPFSNGQAIHAALFPDPESSGYLRQDFTPEAWNTRDPVLPSPFSHWQTIYEKPPPDEKPEAVVDHDPETLLQRMIDQDEPHTEKTRYILAIMLERRKILRETDSQKLPSGLLRVYENRKSGAIYLITDPGISLDEVDQVQAEVRELLE